MTAQTVSFPEFADDCLLYHPIYETSDQHALQKDLDSCDRWGMSVNAAKCEVMRTLRKKAVLQKNIYHQRTSYARNQGLGVIISSNLQWSAHVSTITKKANSTLCFLQRNLKNAPPKLKEIAYFSLVQSASFEAAVTIQDCKPLC